MVKIYNSEKGISYIQLAISLGVVLVIAGFIISIINPLRILEKNNDAKRKQDLGQLQKVLEEYFRDNTRYPASQNFEIIDFKTNTPIKWGGQWIPYMNMLPIDPDPNSKYVYFAKNNNETYYLYAALQDNSDVNRCTSAGAGICQSISQNGIPPYSCGGRCNYGVSSPNTSP